jgi:molybdopterin/thiamine biosynthesis adenylyltransferase
MPLTPYEAERFSRNVLLEGVGEDGQRRLIEASILIIGAGGLGSPAAFYCAAAGVGTIGIVDSDIVDLSNLQRQILHDMSDIGEPKVMSAEKKLRALYPEINIVRHRTRLDADNAGPLIRQYQFVIDATDSFTSKFIINDACVNSGIPFSHAGVCAFQGQLMTVLPGISACYRCVFGKEPPVASAPTTSKYGILGAIAGITGAMQATECIKYLCGIDGLLLDRLMVFDGRDMNSRIVKVKRNPLCCACGNKNIG